MAKPLACSAAFALLRQCAWWCSVFINSTVANEQDKWASQAQKYNNIYKLTYIAHIKSKLTSLELLKHFEVLTKGKKKKSRTVVPPCFPVYGNCQCATLKCQTYIKSTALWQLTAWNERIGDGNRCKHSLSSLDCCCCGSDREPASAQWEVKMVMDSVPFEAPKYHVAIVVPELIGFHLVWVWPLIYGPNADCSRATLQLGEPPLF